MFSVPTYLKARSDWLLPLRLITFSLVFGVIVGWLGFPSSLRGLFLSYCFITLAGLVTLLFLRRTRFHLLFHVLLGLQFVMEVLNEAGIVHATGSLYSPFSALFLLTIVSAALVYRLVGTLLVATFASLIYAAVTFGNMPLFAPGNPVIRSSPGGLFSGDEVLFYSAFLHILIFYLVAFISGYLAEKLQSKDRELHSASDELKKVRLDTGDILRHLNCGLITIDRRGDIVYFNRTAEAIFGLKEQEVAGRHCGAVLGGSMAAMADNLLSVLSSERRLSRSELEIVNTRGQTIPLGISTSLLYDRDFGIRGVIAIFQDLTEVKQMEEKIRQADRMAAVGELSACMAHEIRNPLASISGSVQVLKDELSLDGDNARLMSLIVTETTRLNRILSDFLLYARIGRTQYRKVELNHIVSDIIELVRRHPAYCDHIRIEMASKAPVTYIAGDEDQLKQLVLNLAVNACEAMEGRNGVISFAVTPLAEGSVCLAVRDNGPGIPVDQRNRVFLPFYTTKPGGTGLGLSIVARLTAALGGRVELLSPSGGGAEFRLYFRGFIEESRPSPTASAALPV